MTVPGHIYSRAQNVWDIFFNWQESELDKRYANRARQLRAELDAPPSSDIPAPRAAIILRDVSEPRIEDLAPNESRYILNFCEFQQINATDPEQAIGMLRWLFANERKKRSAELMIALLDDLHAGLWLTNPDWVATRLALYMGATPDTPLLTVPQFKQLYKELRTALDQAKKSPDLDSWWYQLHCLTPRLYLADRHCMTMGEDEAKAYHRFFDEALTDVSSYMSLAMEGWLRGDARALSCSLFFHPFGRAAPKEYYLDKAYRFNLPFFWYDATVAAEDSILAIQHAVLVEKVSIEQAQRGGANVLPECIDAFSPHLLAALMILRHGDLKSSL
jgi:hypothetical protein